MKIILPSLFTIITATAIAALRGESYGLQFRERDLDHNDLYVRDLIEEQQFAKALARRNLLDDDELPLLRGRATLCHCGADAIVVIHGYNVCNAHAQVYIKAGYKISSYINAR